MPKKLHLISNSPSGLGDAIPSGLGTQGRALWAEVTSEYDIADAGGRAMLTAAAHALDRAESCRAIIDEAGEIVKTKHGPREHPLLKAELASRAFVVRTLARLGLNFEPLRHGAGRPPGYA